ncbi:MAG: hypothetical protein D4S01_05455 [Dehalococcoidia bacterium]|nr:MAG: hypothetical protein D4S01_05455 [Dehalococcoidia bacterium]
MGKKVVFHLSRSLMILGKPVFPYEAIRSGRKTIEYRQYNGYWRARLIQANPRPTRAWFVVGYPKGSLLPRLEADITRIVRRRPSNQIEIHFENVVEITDSERLSELPEKFRVVGYFWDFYSAHVARKDCEKQNPTKKYRYRLQLIEFEPTIVRNCQGEMKNV